MYKILFVDDEPWAVIDILHNIPWKELGFDTVGYYEKAREAKEAILLEKPHLVFVDINMPVINGFELIRQCREEGSHAAFVILSAYSDFEFARQAIRASVLDYCLKPVNPGELIKTLEKIKNFLNKKCKRKKIINGDEGEHAAYVPENEERINRIISYVNSHYTERILLKDLAEKFSFNKNYICHLFKKYTGNTLLQYILRLRIEESKKMLKHTNLPLRIIAEELGFPDNCYFNKVFKSTCGMPPHRYRLQYGKRTVSPES